jgi:cysteine-rich repeat protein
MERAIGVVCLLSVMTAVSAVQATEVPLFGTKISVSDKAGAPEKRKLAWAATDPSVSIAGIDPTVSGATLEVVNPNLGSLQRAAFPLPAVGWTTAGNPVNTYKYKDKGVFGPVTKVAVKNGKSIKAGGKGATLTFSLGPAQESVGVSLLVGTQRFCALFGGEVKKDDGAKFIAKKAPAPAACAMLPTTTTTASTSSTTTETASTTTTIVSTTTTTTTTAATTTTTTNTTTTTTGAPTTTTTTATTSTTTSTSGVPVCGNGVPEGAEQCDDGNDDSTDACTNACLDARCGDAIVWSGVEQCDDGNATSGDGCANCVLEPAVCGNGVVQPGETCDDGNTVNGDTCPANCRIESCSPTTTLQQVTVSFTRVAPAPSNVATIVALLDYPDGTVSLPGTGNAATVRARITNTPSGRQVAVNDLEYALRVTVTGTTAITNGLLFRASFDLCAPPMTPVAGQFNCRVEGAGTTTGVDYTPTQLTGITCAVSVP